MTKRYKFERKTSLCPIIRISHPLVYPFFHAQCGRNIAHQSRSKTSLVLPPRQCFPPVIGVKTSSKFSQSQKRFLKNAVRHLKSQNHNVCKRTRDPTIIFRLFFLFSPILFYGLAPMETFRLTHLSVPPTLTLVRLLLLFVTDHGQTRRRRYVTVQQRRNSSNNPKRPNRRKRVYRQFACKMRTITYVCNLVRKTKHAIFISRKLFKCTHFVDQ